MIDLISADTLSSESLTFAFSSVGMMARGIEYDRVCMAAIGDPSMRPMPEPQERRDDRDMYLRCDEGSCFLRFDQAERRVRLAIVLWFPRDWEENDTLGCANEINRGYSIVKACVRIYPKATLLVLEHDLALDGGVRMSALVALVRRFCATAAEALDGQGQGLVPILR